jgi:hypothetical protein
MVDGGLRGKMMNNELSRVNEHGDSSYNYVVSDTKIGLRHRFLRSFFIAIYLVIQVTLIDISTVNAATYRVYVTRIDDDAYLIDGTSRVIITFSCTEYALGDRAILIYEPYGTANRLVFDSEVCDVDSVKTANATLTTLADEVFRDERTGRVGKFSGCYEWVWQEPALILSDRVLFLDSQASCYR